MIRRLGRLLYRYRHTALGRRLLGSLDALYFETHNSNNFDAEFNGEYAILRRLPFRNEAGILFDVGANVGDWAIRAAREIPAATIHAFEPVPSTFRQLTEAISSHGSRVIPHNIGLSDVAGEADFFEYDDNTISSMNPWHPAERLRGKHSVPVLGGDEFCRANKIDKIQFLKIDVEGFELKVLHGFSSMLSSGSIKIIQFEYGAFGPQQRVLIRDFYELLGKDFRLGKLFPTSVEFSEYSGLMEGVAFHNFVAVHRSIDGEVT